MFLYKPLDALCARETEQDEMGRCSGHAQDSVWLGFKAAVRRLAEEPFLGNGDLP